MIFQQRYIRFADSEYFTRILLKLMESNLYGTNVGHSIKTTRANSPPNLVQRAACEGTKDAPSTPRARSPKAAKIVTTRIETSSRSDFIYFDLPFICVVGTFEEAYRLQYGWRPEEVRQEDTVKLCHNYFDKARHIQDAASFPSFPNLYEVPVDDGFGRRQNGQVVIFEARPEDPGLQVRGSPEDTEGFNDEGPDTPAAPVAKHQLKIKAAWPKFLLGFDGKVRWEQVKLEVNKEVPQPKLLEISLLMVSAGDESLLLSYLHSIISGYQACRAC
ncbi:hypothetical protein LAZ67_12003217 [Cordylochernes scorpioides]|uniref:Uncharacterized protein n=1 Tax=Cordylochernes scorpioides TaxID=51811 RepID=A0ABY6L4Q3_9ARAC|nr:hypothetical protein LAZ67_12003217 [Cordylochernes scorpioides]